MKSKGIASFWELPISQFLWKTCLKPKDSKSHANYYWDLFWKTWHRVTVENDNFAVQCQKAFFHRVYISTRPSSRWGIPGIEPGTSRTLSENHAARPNPQAIWVTARWLGYTNDQEVDWNTWTWNKYANPPQLDPDSRDKGSSPVISC